jgi:hypothetical protein
MITSFLKRVPWEKFFLLWFLALLMGTALLWLHYGFTERILAPFLGLIPSTGAGLLWATTRPRWAKAHCAWCAARVSAHALRYDEGRKVWVTLFHCAKCGHVTEKMDKA